MKTIAALKDKSKFDEKEAFVCNAFARNKTTANCKKIQNQDASL
jgi:hypothetical protein